MQKLPETCILLTRSETFGEALRQSKKLPPNFRIDGRRIHCTIYFSWLRWCVITISSQMSCVSLRPCASWNPALMLPVFLTVAVVEIFRGEEAVPPPPESWAAPGDDVTAQKCSLRIGEITESLLLQTSFEYFYVLRETRDAMTEYVFY